MAVPYEELAASPSFVMDRDGGSAVRTVRVAWSDIGRVILEVFPGALFGYPYTASVPGFPWLRAQKMSIDPWNPEHPSGHDPVMNTYPGGAKITVEYAPNKFPDNDQSDGPAGNSLQDITFLEQKINFGGEYLTWPNNGVRWENNVNGAELRAYLPGGGGGQVPAVPEKNFQVFEDIQVGVVIPTIEHTLNWKYVRFPPWVGIRNCIGKVNIEPFMGCHIETLLFSGASASRTYSTQGSPTWSLEYRLTEKCYNAPVRNTLGLGNVQVTTAGTGYAIGDRLRFVGGNGTPSEFRVTALFGASGILAVEIINRGAYYTVPDRPNRVFSVTGMGSGAEISGAFNFVRQEPAFGWNHFLRPQTGKFERMVRKDGTGVYQSTQMRQIFGGLP